MGQVSAQTKHRAEGYQAGDLDRPAGERWVTMSNALTRGAHGLTLAEKRIVASAVSKLDSRRVLPPGEVPRTRITAMEYAETFSVDMDTAYDQLQAAAKQLYKRSITFYEPAHKRNGKPLPPTMVQMRWVGSVKYQKGEGWVELAWWPDLLRHLVGLKAQFTTYQLQQASALRSAYSWKLLELLTRFQSTGMAEYTIEDFLRIDGGHRKAGRRLRQGANQDHRASGEGTHRKRRLADSVASSQSRPKSEGRSLHLHAQSTREPVQ